ncbi:hypothetical protein MauCBS54593_000387 [Microsporum audouinii]
MISDSEIEEGNGTPVPGSSLDPDSPLVDSPVYPGSPRRAVASYGEEDSFVSEPVVEATVEPTTQPNRSPIPPPNPSCKVDDGFSTLAQELEGYTWEQLQQRFIEEMDERSKTENILQKETADLLEVFMAWSQTTTFRDEDRAYKRFKTRMDHVQNSEASLEEKKAHYASVVKAFENALDLLRTG